jgi:hypothetical protein
MSNTQNNQNQTNGNGGNANNNGNAGAKHVRRAYGKERIFGDILFNPETKSVFSRIDLGAFSLNLSLALRSDKKTYDLYKSYTARDGSLQLVKLGQTFPVTRRDGSEVENVSKATLGLFREYDKELKKELTRSNDALFITVIKLKDPKVLGESGLKKVGLIAGVFGIELADENEKAKAKSHGGADNNGEQPIDNADYYADEQPAQQPADDEEIPF